MPPAGVTFIGHLPNESKGEKVMHRNELGSRQRGQEQCAFVCYRCSRRTEPNRVIITGACFAVLANFPRCMLCDDPPGKNDRLFLM